MEYDRFNLEWEARSLSPISNFKVEWKTNGDEKWKTSEVEAYQLPNADNTYAGTHMITKLNPATVYLVKVSSRNVYGYSNPSQPFKFATRGAGNWQITHLVHGNKLFYLLCTAHHTHIHFQFPFKLCLETS